MSAADAIAVLKGELHRPALGLTWVGEPAISGLSEDRGPGRPAAALPAVAIALGCDLAFVEAEQPWASDAALELAEAGIAVAAALAGVMGRVAEHQGWTEVLRLSASEPGALAHQLDRALHDLLESAREALTYANVLVVADDIASTAGWLVAPDYALEALVPCYRRVAAEASGHRVPVVFHSDGDVRALYPSLASAGYAGVHLGGGGRQAIEAAMPVASRHGLALLGGVSPSEVASEGPRHLGERLAHLASAGPLVICDDGGITAPDEVAALATVFDAVRQYAG